MYAANAKAQSTPNPLVHLGIKLPQNAIPKHKAYQYPDQAPSRSVATRGARASLRRRRCRGLRGQRGRARRRRRNEMNLVRMQWCR